jgi:hypothetical protein
VVNYKDDLGGATNAGKFLTVATDGESLTMVDEPSGVPDWITFVPRSMRLFTSAVSYPATIEWTYLDADDVLTIGGTIGFFISGKVLEIKNKFQGETMKMSGGDISFMLEGEQLFRIRLLELTHYGDDFNMIAQDVFGASPLYNLNFKGRINSSSNRYTFSSISGGKENVTEDDKAGFLSFKTGIDDGTLTERLRISSGGNVGVGVTPSARLDVLGKAIIIGSNNGDETARTDSTVKVGAITFPHYYNVQKDIAALVLVGTLTSNEVDIGGGTSSYNAATQLRFFTAPNNTDTGLARLTISSGGLATFSNGIKFGTGATLDAYEEGTWDPVYSFSGGGTVTQTSTHGYYVRIGNTVTVGCNIRSIAVSGISGNLAITGLPFDVKNNNGTRMGGAIGFNRNWGSDMPNFRIYTTPNTDKLDLYKNAMNAGTSTVTTSDFSTGTSSNVIEFSITYITG